MPSNLAKKEQYQKRLLFIEKEISYIDHTVDVEFSLPYELMSNPIKMALPHFHRIFHLVNNEDPFRVILSDISSSILNQLMGDIEDNINKLERIVEDYALIDYAKRENKRTLYVRVYNEKCMIVKDLIAKLDKIDRLYDTIRLSVEEKNEALSIRNNTIECVRKAFGQLINISVSIQIKQDKRIKGHEVSRYILRTVKRLTTIHGVKISEDTMKRIERIKKNIGKGRSKQLNLQTA